MRVHFVGSVLLLKEVYKLEDVGGGGHPFGWISDAEVGLEAKLLQATVGDVLNVLVHIVRIEAQYAFRKHVFVVIYF